MGFRQLGSSGCRLGPRVQVEKLKAVSRLRGRRLALWCLELGLWLEMELVTW